MNDTAEALNPMRAVRHALGLTQEEMAREMKCSWGTIRNCERDAKLPHGAALRSNLADLASRANIEIPLGKKL